MTADGFDIAAGDNALAVGEQHDLEQHRGRIGGGPCFIIPEPGIEAGQIQLVVDKVIQRMLEGTGKQLPLQVNRKETWAGVYVFVARHVVSAIAKSMRRC